MCLLILNFLLILKNFAPNLNFAGTIISKFNVKSLNLVPANNGVLKVHDNLANFDTLLVRDQCFV